MRNKVFFLTVLLTLGLGGLLAVGLSSKASAINFETLKNKSLTGKLQGQVTVTVTPVSPTQEQVNSTINAVKMLPSVTKFLGKTENRLISVEYPESLQSLEQKKLRATFYDYTNNRPIVVDTIIGDTRQTTAVIGSTQPLPSSEEFDAAVLLAKSDPNFSSLFKSGATTYRSMPPLTSESVTSERTLTVGIMAPGTTTPNQIVAVNMINKTVTTFVKNAPPTAMALEAVCGSANAGQATTSRGTAGQFNLTISVSGTPIWQMLVIRPSASSGTRASGVELRDVSYLGKPILKRAHVPILNVLYDNNACGPYRDWQWQEGMFTANGTDVASGIRLCTSAPQTVIESMNDTGNFRGVAIYQDPNNNEVQIVSEMEAGWYRYISRWEFSPAGVIRSRFGFDGVANSCICNAHRHHAYWRLDFDIASAGHNRFTQYDTRSFFTPLLTESKAFRDYIRGRYWTVENLASGELVTIQPGPNDGVADTYARGDAWFLRYRSTELDDGHNSTGSGTEADLDQFVNGESINEQDVVMWYAGHFYHVYAGGESGHLVGPDIIVNRW
ncbi:MAG: hypothetical protein JST85_09460 [Acidobacteria bacterium]|nr:hypothetical protein [Acidobacteriota bacterium]